MHDHLTDAQRLAVAHTTGPMLILAGPGSGKTTVVAQRIAAMVHRGVPPRSMLALTFTNKAAGEMRQRVIDRCGEEAMVRGMTVATFHSFCARFLRRHADRAGISPNYAICDARDQRDLIKAAIIEAGQSTSNWPPATVGQVISGAKNRLLTAEEFSGQAVDFYQRTIARIYRAYHDLLRASDLLDFDDLLLKTARLLLEDDALREATADRFQFVMVDEYQDTNHAQFVICRSIAGGHSNIMVVGDPDQSIYAWRGADITNIMEFELHWPDAQVVELGRNFRSTGHIVDAAAALISRNTNRREKRLYTELEHGTLPRVLRCRDERHEAESIVAHFRHLATEESLAWKDMAILYRVNALSRVLEETLRNAKIPYVIARGTAFYDRAEIRDALAYLKVVRNARDEISLKRVINTPPRGIGKTTVDRMAAYAAIHRTSLASVIDDPAPVPQLAPRAIKSVTGFAKVLQSWRLLLSGPPDAEHLAELVERIIEESGLEAQYRNAGADEDRQRILNLEELISAASRFEPVVDDDDDAPLTTLHDFLIAWLESIALVSDADVIDPESGAVTLMTLHAAKGLEYPAIAIAGLEEGLLPHLRSREDDAALEEERRLLYVGMTRAKRHLMLSSAAVRTLRGERTATIPSRFIEELPAASIEGVDCSGAPHQSGGSPGVSMAGGRARRLPDPEGFKIGARVWHELRGPGVITAMTKRAGGTTVQVEFIDDGIKTMVLAYSGLQLVSTTPRRGRVI
jgi:DNA helicase-2/ATP-dependent DNA helicase PcrA